MKQRELAWSFVFLIFIVGIVLKIGLVFALPVHHDVGWYISLAEHHDSAYMNLIVLEHPPFGYYPFLLGMSIFGIDDTVIRFVSFLFSILELLLLYLIAKKWFGNITSQYVIILFSLTYFATVNALSPEGDGSIMGFVSLLFFYFVYEFYKSKKYWNLMWSGFFLGVLLLIKVRAVLFFIPFVFYCLYKTRSVIQTVKDGIAVLLCGSVIFSIFPLLVYLSSPEAYLRLLQQVLLHNTGTFSIFYKLTHPLIFIHVAVVLTFLYFFLFFESIRGFIKEIKEIKEAEKITTRTGYRLGMRSEHWGGFCIFTSAYDTKYIYNPAPPPQLPGGGVDTN
jgi:4-amino-4-deoxy-L-arabinose transferase-like glycosyltransferase